MSEERSMLDFIFIRELSEVYLLLDNVSMSANKTLLGADGASDADGGKDWIEQICEIGWPPHGSKVEQAFQAATLMRARDRLNNLAAPATGATIAFTLLVLGDDAADRRRGMFSQLISWLRGPSHKSRAVAAESMDAADSQAVRAGARPRFTTSRSSLARDAFPGLIKRAANFRMMIQLFILGLFVCLALTCALSWNVAVGNAALGQLAALATEKADIDKQVSDAEAGVDNSGAPATAAANAVAPPPSGAPKAAKPIVRYCERPLLLPPALDDKGRMLVDKTKTPVEQFDSAAQRRICDRQAEYQQKHAIAEANVGGWLNGWSVLGVARPVQSKAVEGDSVNDQWAAILTSVLGGTVLPVFYGILGAAAAVVRGLSRKMRDSLLSPRDRMLALVQLALGAVIGACIGLFVPTSGSAGQNTAGLLGPIPLSASALSFIAGFGVEGVFAALESLITRIFNISDPNKKTA